MLHTRQYLVSIAFYTFLLYAGHIDTQDCQISQASADACFTSTTLSLCLRWRPFLMRSCCTCPHSTWQYRLLPIFLWGKRSVTSEREFTKYFFSPFLYNCSSPAIATATLIGGILRSRCEGRVGFYKFDTNLLSFYKLHQMLINHLWGYSRGKFHFIITWNISTGYRHIDLLFFKVFQLI